MDTFGPQRLCHGLRQAALGRLGWPTGNKTILARDGDFFTINGKPSIPYAEDGYTLCALNSKTRNRFCFKL